MKRLQTEHWLLLAGFFAAAATTMGSIDHWNEAFKPGVVGGLLAQLAIMIRTIYSPPLKPAPLDRYDDGHASPRLLTWVALGALAAFTTGGCALSTSSPHHQATVTSGTVYEALAAVQDTEATLFKNGAVTPADHKSFNAELVKALEAGQDFNRVVMNWPPKTPAPAALAASADNVSRLLESTIRLLPIGTARDAVTIKALAVQRAIVSVILAH